jgi:hypothetical protein
MSSAPNTAPAAPSTAGTTAGTGAAAKDPKYMVKKEDIPKILNLLKSIEDDPGAEPFLEPVAWQGKQEVVLMMMYRVGVA